MDDGDKRQLDVLAEIIASKRVGRDHVRLAAEIVIADDDLTGAVLACGEPATERWFDANEEIQDRVEEYQEAWVILNSVRSVMVGGRLTSEAAVGLDRLALTMRAAIDQYKATVARLNELGNSDGLGANDF
ncbi:hypothetical protein ACN27F_29820 [Solwaraspora sp. WMMB335]|uniref:hypothetical protein n=1 Tax=Solwaraspora sp. WMMB335 TaxID=3404118 RepID=UPI003B925EBA